MKTLVLLLALVTVLTGSILAQLPEFDASKVPDSASKPAEFAPAGWKVEGSSKGDLNGDGTVDYAIKIIEDRGKAEPAATDGDRYLVIAFGEGGKLKKAAVAKNILQCLECGGAFYGAMPAPARVSIAKGILTIENEHGSRNVSVSTFKFKYSTGSGKLELIGYDYQDNDRLTGVNTTESSNYITGVRVTSTGKRRMTTRRTKFKPQRITLDDADYSEMETAALNRLGLG